MFRPVYSGTGGWMYSEDISTVDLNSRVRGTCDGEPRRLPSVTVLRPFLYFGLSRSTPWGLGPGSSGPRDRPRQRESGFRGFLTTSGRSSPSFFLHLKEKFKLLLETPSLRTPRVPPLVHNLGQPGGWYRLPISSVFRVRIKTNQGSYHAC